jgi:hypothetical protein
MQKMREKRIPHLRYLKWSWLFISIGDILRVMVFNTQKNVYNTQTLLPESSFLEIF